MEDRDLEAEIRTIIHDDYGVGDQNIESREIYYKLIERGIDVPEGAMGKIFDSLKKRTDSRDWQNESRRSSSSRPLVHHVD